MNVKRNIETLPDYTDLVSRWNETHRYYHTYNNHFIKLENKIELLDGVTDDDKTILWLAAVFHDIIYIPSKSNDVTNRLGYDFSWNEASSFDFFTDYVVRNKIDINTDVISQVSYIILKTGYNTLPEDSNYTRLCDIFLSLDREILTSNNIVELLDYEDKIFKEFQCFEWSKYKLGRVKFLRSFSETNPTLGVLADIVEKRKPKVGLYAGSFNPFHIGHLHVLTEAEKVFDKVIVLFGTNPSKATRKPNIPHSISNRQVVIWEGLLTDFIEENCDECDITIIKGVRNGNDLQSEKDQLFYMRELSDKVNMFLVPNKPEHESISSSYIRSLEALGTDLYKKYLV